MTYEEIGRQIGELVDTKNKQYGDAFNKTGDFLEILYPNGIEVEDYVALEQWAPVIPETVGQFTGLDDRYGKDIYEGDIGWYEHYEVYGVVKYDESNFLFIFEYLVDDLYENNKSIEIVGNKYDNPELLGEVRNEREVYSRN